MNYNRFAFFTIISILSNLLDNAVLAEAKTSTNLVIEQAIISVDSNENIGHLDRGNLKTISMPFNGAPFQIARANPSIDSDRSDERLKNSTAEEPLVMSKRLGLTGIAIVSFVSLILLKFLFITPVKKASSTPISSAVNKDSKTIENDPDVPLKDLPQSPDFEPIPTFAGISPSSVRSSDGEQYVAPKKSIVENFETTSQLTQSNFNIPKIDVVVELIKYLQQPDDDLRREAIWELAQIGDSRGIKPLTEILSQVNSTDRSLVIEAITQITKRSLQPIQELLFFTFDDANPEIKQNAIHDLAAVYAFVAPITKQIARMQVDRDVQVRQTAKLAIEQLNLCYFPCLFDDCPNSVKYDSNSNGKKIDRVK